MSSFIESPNRAFLGGRAAARCKQECHQKNSRRRETNRSMGKKQLRLLLLRLLRRFMSNKIANILSLCSNINEAILINTIKYTGKRQYLGRHESDMHTTRLCHFKTMRNKARYSRRFIHRHILSVLIFITTRSPLDKSLEDTKWGWGN